MADTPNPNERYSRLEHRRKLRSQEKYIIDKIFPAGGLHILSGSSGSGKSTWLFQQLYEWSHGRPVLGYPSFPCPWVMLTYDRGSLDNDQTLRRIGLGEWDLPIYAFEDLYRGGQEPDLFSLCKDPRFTEIELFVVEGLMSFVPDPKPKQSQNKCEQMWVSRIRNEILQHGKTVIGTAHLTKQQQNQVLTRTNMLGSASFIGGISTVVLFDDLADAKKLKAQNIRVHDNGKLVSVCPRQAKDIHVQYSRDEVGRFVEFDEDAAELIGPPDIGRFGSKSGADTARETLLELIKETPNGDLLTTKVIESTAEGQGWSRPTTHRFISEQVEKGLLVRQARGTYMKSGGVN